MRGILWPFFLIDPNTNQIVKGNAISPLISTQIKLFKLVNFKYQIIMSKKKSNKEKASYFQISNNSIKTIQIKYKKETFSIQEVLILI